MPSFCGLSVHRSRNHCRKESLTKSITHHPNNVRTPARPQRDDGLFGVPAESRNHSAPQTASAPAQVYPPVRSPLRNGSERRSTERHSGDHCFGLAGVVAPAPLKPKQRSHSVETGQRTMHKNTQTNNSVKNRGISESPRYGPQSRPPVSQSRMWQEPQRSVRAPINHESGRQSRRGVRNDGGESPEPPQSNRPPCRSPRAPTTPTWDLPDDEPIYFVPVCFSPDSFKSRYERSVSPTGDYR